MKESQKVMRLRRLTYAVIMTRILGHSSVLVEKIGLVGPISNPARNGLLFGKPDCRLWYWAFFKAFEGGVIRPCSIQLALQ